MAKEIVSPAGAGLVLASITGADARGFALGDGGTTKDGGGALFCQAGAAITQGHVLSIGPTYTAKPIATAEHVLGYKVGFAYDAVASGEYFWARVDPKGEAVISTAINCGAGARLFLTATAGVLDDATNAYEVFGLELVSASSSAETYDDSAIATYPRVRT